jgi:LacI family transcriptional regulator
VSAIKPARHVALLIETSRAYGRGLLEGIARYVREHGHWTVRLQDRGLNDPLPDWLTRWPVDGVLARVETPELEDQLLRLRKPALNLCGTWTGSRLTVLDTDDPAVARLAFEHLRERGFTRLAYCGFGGTGWSEVRGRCFAQLAEAAGIPCQIYAPKHKPQRALTLTVERHGMLQEAHLSAWLRSLPKPIGLLVANDMRGQQVIDLCAELGLNVPDEVAVLGVDNDEVLCELTSPPLSSVIPDCQRIGYEAAQHLDHLMSGRKPSLDALIIPPAGVATRRSTDVLALDDRHVATTLRFIREQACTGISVEDVLGNVPLSRSSLERRFVKLVGRAPKAEILRVQLERAKQLLTETDWTLAAIAEHSGFRHTEHFCTLFKSKTGQTPGRFRKSNPRG